MPCFTFLSLLAPPLKLVLLLLKGQMPPLNITLHPVSPHTEPLTTPFLQPVQWNTPMTTPPTQRKFPKFTSCLPTHLWWPTDPHHPEPITLSWPVSSWPPPEGCGTYRGTLPWLKSWNTMDQHTGRNPKAMSPTGLGPTTFLQHPTFCEKNGSAGSLVTLRLPPVHKCRLSSEFCHLPRRPQPTLSLLLRTLTCPTWRSSSAIPTLFCPARTGFWGQSCDFLNSYRQPPWRTWLYRSSFITCRNSCS